MPKAVKIGDEARTNRIRRPGTKTVRFDLWEVGTIVGSTEPFLSRSIVRPAVPRGRRRRSGPRDRMSRFRVRVRDRRSRARVLGARRHPGQPTSAPRRRGARHPAAAPRTRRAVRRTHLRHAASPRPRSARPVTGGRRAVCARDRFPRMGRLLRRSRRRGRRRPGTAVRPTDGRHRTWRAAARLRIDQPLTRHARVAQVPESGLDVAVTRETAGDRFDVVEEVEPVEAGCNPSDRGDLPGGLADEDVDGVAVSISPCTSSPAASSSSGSARRSNPPRRATCESRPSAPTIRRAVTV